MPGSAELVIFHKNVFNKRNIFRSDIMCDKVRREADNYDAR